MSHYSPRKTYARRARLFRVFPRKSHAVRTILPAALLLVAIGAFADPLPRFPPGAVWNQDVSAPELKHPSSDEMIAWLQSHGGWGTGSTAFQIDFSMAVLHAGASTPTVANIGYPYDDYYSPDCDDPGTVP